MISALLSSLKPGRGQEEDKCVYAHPLVLYLGVVWALWGSGRVPGCQSVMLLYPLKPHDFGTSFRVVFRYGLVLFPREFGKLGESFCLFVL